MINLQRWVCMKILNNFEYKLLYILQLMGTCISRPKNITRSRNPEKFYLQQPQSSNCQPVPNESQLNITTNNSVNYSISYPYFHPRWTLSKDEQTNKIADIAKIVGKSTVNNKDWLHNYLNWRYYSHSQIENRKYFTIKPQTVLSNDNHEWVKASTLQTLLFATDQTCKIKTCPSFEYIDASLNLNYEKSEDSVLTINENMPVLYHLFQNHKSEIVVDRLTDRHRMNQLFNTLKECKKTNLNTNCLFNGILFRSSIQNANAFQNKRYINPKFNDILQIFNQHVEEVQFTDQIVCYINPLLRPKMKINKKKCNFSSYLQLKSELQSQHLDIQSLFDPDLIMKSNKCQLFCIYILLFCLKVVMFNNPNIQQIPNLFLNEFIKMRPDEKNILNKAVNVMIFCYAVFLPHQNDDSTHVYDPELARNCCRNVLQISSVNSHILLDAYLLQFSIQVEEKSVPIRQNPLTQLTQPMRCRNLITLEINKKMVKYLRILMDTQVSQLISQLCIKQMEQPKRKQMALNNIRIIIEKWEKETFKQVQRNASIANMTKEYFSPNSFIIFEYFLAIKIFKFISIAQISIDLLATSSILLKDSSLIKIMKRDWCEVIEDFMSNTAFNYCSGQLAITVLTLDALVKMLDFNQNIEQIKQNLKKCIEIWFRIYRDPRAKYRPYLPNNWIVYIIDLLVKVKIKNLSDNFSTQSIFYLQNILQCFYNNTDAVDFGNPTNIQWIFTNLPIKSISGIFYNKIDLIAPTNSDDKSGFLMRTGSSLIESQGDLSSKSNFSQTISNKNSISRKRNRYGNIQISQFSECKAIRNGIYIWGKGVNSIPLIYPFSKNLDVLKISCGNFHVVLATSVGIFGWGENASGQLGQPSKQPIRTIKMILSKIIVNSESVNLSCGNQHTAILFKQQNLIMFGQSDCGIISGNGYKFDSVSCGGLHTLGIREGKVYSWGRGQGGQLGHKTTELKTKVKNQSTDFYLDSPKVIQSIPPIIKSVCGDAHSVLLTKQGEVYVFGFSYQGQLGLGITGDNDIFQIFEPVKLNFSHKNKGNKIVDIYAGSTFSFFKTSQGQILSCGLNDYNQLGMEQMMKVFHKKKYLGQQKKSNERKLGQAQFSKPNKIEIFNSQTKVTQIFCGENHCLASVEYMNKNKMVMGWGLNKQLQISSEFPHESIKPRTIDNIYDFNFESLCCGSNYSLGYIRQQNRLTLRQLEENIEQLLRNCVKYTKVSNLEGKDMKKEKK